jgi:hypothetical protein
MLESAVRRSTEIKARRMARTALKRGAMIDTDEDSTTLSTAQRRAGGGNDVRLQPRTQAPIVASLGACAPKRSDHRHFDDLAQLDQPHLLYKPRIMLFLAALPNRPWNSRSMLDGSVEQGALGIQLTEITRTLEKIGK